MTLAAELAGIVVRRGATKLLDDVRLARPLETI